MEGQNRCRYGRKFRGMACFFGVGGGVVFVTFNLAGTLHHNVVH